jgi:hypothetical protein
MKRSHFIRSAIVTGVALVATLSGLSHAAASSPYAFTSFSYPKDTFTQLLSVNDAGRIAGYHGEKINKGFTLTLPGTIQNENFPKSMQTQVIGINNLGDTVGFYVDGKNTTHGFYRNPRLGKWWTIDVPGTGFNQLLGVNDHGSTAGYYQFGKDNVFQPFTRVAAGAFHLPPIPNAQMTGVNNEGYVTGFQVVSSTVNRAFVVTGNQVRYFQYPGSTFTQALGLNNQGEVVGTYNDKGGTAHGFTYSIQSRAFHSIDAPDSTATVINGVNNHGWIVGFYTAKNKDTVGLVGKPQM